MVAVVITRGELDPAGLRREASLSKDGAGGASDAGLGAGPGGSLAHGGGEHVRDGPADLA